MKNSFTPFQSTFPYYSQAYTDKTFFIWVTRKKIKVRRKRQAKARSLLDSSVTLLSQNTIFPLLFKLKKYIYTESEPEWRENEQSAPYTNKKLDFRRF